MIENREATEVMRAHDSAATLHYVDPPYLPEVRSHSAGRPLHTYRHELAQSDHVALLDFLQALDGMVVLSGYPSPLYDRALKGWSRFEIDALADGARPRREVVWLNPACVVARGAGPLFAAVS